MARAHRRARACAYKKAIRAGSTDASLFERLLTPGKGLLKSQETMQAGGASVRVCEITETGRGWCSHIFTVESRSRHPRSRSSLRPFESGPSLIIQRAVSPSSGLDRRCASGFAPAGYARSACLTIVGFRSSLRRRGPERPTLRAFAVPFSSGSFPALAQALETALSALRTR